MKTSSFKTLSKDAFLVTLIAIMAFSFSSCATRAHFEKSSVVPAAQGVVKVTKDKNNNYAIKIEITNLAEVDRLQPPRKTYIVWLVSNKEETQNIGQIESSSGTFSSKLKAKFETVTSYKPTKIFITAEDDTSILYPSTQVILTTDRFQSESVNNQITSLPFPSVLLKRQKNQHHGQSPSYDRSVSNHFMGNCFFCLKSGTSHSYHACFCSNYHIVASHQGNQGIQLMSCLVVEKQSITLLKINGKQI